nr:sulfite exporter TauE/SafE family protein [Thermoflexibacter sp.]
MTTEFIFLAFGLFLLVAFLYSTVGHAGASGYLAVMALLSFPESNIKTISLVLNIIVASIASYKYIKAGFFDKKIFLTFAITSIPAAFVGGMLSVTPTIFKLLAGIFLLLSSVLLVLKKYLSKQKQEIEKNIPLLLGLSIGTIIGLFSGLIGVGGGIFLSPLMILMSWTGVRKASGISALFILCNSAISLTGNLIKGGKLDSYIFFWMIAVVIGGVIGSHLGSNRTGKASLSDQIIVAFLFVVLFSAGIK